LKDVLNNFILIIYIIGMLNRDTIRNLITNNNVYNLRDGTTNTKNPLFEAPTNVTSNDPYIMTESSFLASFNTKEFPSEEAREEKLIGIYPYRRGAISSSTITNENITNAIHLHRYVNVLLEQIKNICRTGLSQGATVNDLKLGNCSRAQTALGHVMEELSTFIRIKYFYGGKKNSKTKHKSHRKNRLSKSHSRRRSYSRKLKR
jgi:hypothetical protein